MSREAGRTQNTRRYLGETSLHHVEAHDTPSPILAVGRNHGTRTY